MQRRVERPPPRSFLLHRNKSRVRNGGRSHEALCREPSWTRLEGLTWIVGRQSVSEEGKFHFAETQRRRRGPPAKSDEAQSLHVRVLSGGGTAGGRVQDPKGHGVTRGLEVLSGPERGPCLGQTKRRRCGLSGALPRDTGGWGTGLPELGGPLPGHGLTTSSNTRKAKCVARMRGTLGERSSEGPDVSGSIRLGPGWRG